MLVAALDRSLIEVDRGLEDAAAGHGRVIVVAGAAGIGKSTLLSDTGRAARSRGFVVVPARGRPRDCERSGATLNAALAQIPEPPVSEADGLAARLLRVEPVSLIVDDAHLADAESRETIVDYAERAAAHRALLVVAVRPHLLDDDGRVWVDELVRFDDTLSITLLPLNRERSDHLIRSIIPDAGAVFCEACAQLTGGNPYLLKELVTWISAHRLDPTEDAPLRALEPAPPRAMRRFVRHQVEELGPPAATVAAALAFADRPLDVDEAARMGGFDRTTALDAIDQLLESGVFVPGERLEFAAPVTLHCLRASAPPDLAARMRRQAAELASGNAPDSQTRGRHLLLAPPTGDPQVVESLVELADREEAQGLPNEAGALIRRALDERVDDRHANARLLVRLGQLTLMQGEGESTASLATGIAGLDRDKDRADGLLTLAIARLEAGSLREAANAFEHAAALAGGDDPLRVRAAAKSAIADLLVPERRDAAAMRLDELRRDRRGSEQPVEAELLLATAWLATAHGESHRTIVDTVHRALHGRGSHPAPGGYFQMVAAALLALADEFAAAEDIIKQGRAHARAAGSALAERNLLLAQAIREFHVGQLDGTATLCQQLLASDASGQRFSRAAAAAILAEILQEQDEFDEADALIRTTLEWAPNELAQLLLLHARARLCLRRDALGPALSASHETEDLALSLGIVNPVALAWQPTVAVCYARSGDQRRAFELVEETEAVAERFGTARARSLALRTRAFVFHPPNELELLERALAEVGSSPAQLERAQVFVQYGSALHRVGSEQAARTFLRRGVDLADRIGAHRISRQGRATLVAAGGRPRRARLSGPEALTPAERQVVELASAGATNREIAEKLVITRKTVEWHLRKAFAKLGVRSRDELARAMGQSSITES